MKPRKASSLRRRRGLVWSLMSSPRSSGLSVPSMVRRRNSAPLTMGDLMSSCSSAIWRMTRRGYPSAGTGSESCKPASLLETMLLPSMRHCRRNSCFGHHDHILKRRSITSMLRSPARRAATPHFQKRRADVFTSRGPPVLVLRSFSEGGAFRGFGCPS